MHKTILILLITFFMTEFLYSQQVCTGKVIDLKSKQAMPYVNVGIIGGNTGTVTNPDGYFTFNIPDSILGGSLRISTYGYEPVVMAVSEFLQTGEEGMVISLAEKVFEQEEMVVRAPDLKEKVLGRKSENGFITLGFQSQQLGTELGLPIRIKSRTYIDNFNFFVMNQDYDSLTLRLNFYACDKKGHPIDSLVQKGTVFHLVGSQQGLISIDLREEHIILKDDVFMSLEVVDGFTTVESEEERSLFFGAKMIGEAFARYTSQSEWMDIPIVTPGFFITVQQETGR